MGKRPKGDLELFKFIGQQIKKARVGDNIGHTIMTQTTLANAIGVTFQQVQKYEKGVNRVPIDKLLAIGIKTKTLRFLANIQVHNGNLNKKKGLNLKLCTA